MKIRCINNVNKAGGTFKQLEVGEIYSEFEQTTNYYIINGRKYLKKFFEKVETTYKVKTPMKIYKGKNNIITL